VARIFIDINHPAYFHFFRPFILQMQQKGHTFFLAVRNKDVLPELTGFAGLKYYEKPALPKDFWPRLFFLLHEFRILYNRLRSFKPSLIMGFSPYAAILSFILSRPFIAFEDTELSDMDHLLFRLFAKKIFTPACFKKSLGKKQIRFNGYKELAYLHPSVFAPDKAVRHEMGLADHEKYVICRFVAWGARHDQGHTGINPANKLAAVKAFSHYARVFISSELPLDVALDAYRFPLGAHRLHHALAFASLMFGESSTMAAEAAVLGVPSVYVDNEGRGYTDDIEHRYGLIQRFGESEVQQIQAINRAVQILADPTAANKARNASLKLISEHTDITAIFMQMVETEFK